MKIMEIKIVVKEELNEAFPKYEDTKKIFRTTIQERVNNFINENREQMIKDLTTTGETYVAIETEGWTALEENTFIELFKETIPQQYQNTISRNYPKNRIETITGYLRI